MTQRDTQEALLDRARLVIRELKEKLASAEALRPEPIAVIGMACRFPGKATSCDAFWRLIEAGEDTTSGIPTDRWDSAALYDPDPAARGKIATQYGSFLENVDRFDAAFFDIPPREAVFMDPQQRLFLEVAWQALEDAGQVRQELAGSETGVFVGVHNHSNDYYGLQSADLSDIDTYTGPGTGQDVIAGRLAYWLDLHGPCAAINTACSSSLVAVHLARRSLLARDCRMALVGGVNLILRPASTVMISRLSMLSPDGRCKAFDDRADGFGRGEGCGVLVLKRLSEAITDRDRILSVIRGSAVNQDGKTNGLTAPNGLSQQRVIRKALQDAGLEPSEIGYVEAHGTGTALGDPIEVEALGSVLGQPGADGPACGLGSVKANIGHLEGAAGIAGMIKSILVLRNRVIPPVAGFKQLNPHISLDGTRLFIPKTPQRWEPASGRRRVGVSSFGWSGTNAHVVLEDMPDEPAGAAPTNGRAVVIPVSAASSDALRQAAATYADLVQGAVFERLPDLAYTAGARRTQHEFRFAAAGTSPAAIAAELREKAAQSHAIHPAKTQPKIGFVYSGQGSRFLCTGKELLREEPVFRQVIEACAAEVRKAAGWDLVKVLMTADAQTELSTDYAQPAIFALQAGLTELLRSWGLRAEAVAGHSLGEIAAAWAAGALTLTEGVRLVVNRGRLMQATCGMGSTASIGAPQSVVRDWIRTDAPELSIAAVNSSTSTVVAGNRTAVERILERARTSGAAAKLLSADYAFHTALMEETAKGLVRVMQNLQFREASLPVYSTVSGRLAGAADFGPEYWGRNLRQPVLFSQAIAAMTAAGFDTFVEIGPGSALTPMIAECGGSHQRVLPLMRRGFAERLSVLHAVAGLYEAGAEIDWKRLNGEGKCVKLPSYPFQRKSFWLETKGEKAAGTAEAAPDDWFYEIAWREKNLRSAGLNPVSVEDIANKAGLRLLDESGTAGIARVSVDKLEREAAAYMAAALRTLGFTFLAGDRFTPEELATRLQVSEKHQALFRKILGTLANQGLLCSVSGGFEATGLLPGALPAPNGGPGCIEQSLLHKCGRRLAEVLTGAQNPLELLFTGDGASAEDLYRESVTMRAYNSLVREAFSLLLSQFGSSRQLRILEIGAGTGATTSAVLEAPTESISEYVFTDVSRLLLTLAAERFKDAPFLRYELLDLDGELQGQGFTEGGYDIVIAANVLHATADLAASLGKARRLLAPGGVLLLLETVESRNWIDLTFGLTEGWWKFTDRQVRTDGPLISREKWLELMRESGFDQVAACALDNPARSLIQEAVFLARNPANSDDLKTGMDAGNWLVFGDGTGVADQFAAIVRTHRGNAVLVQKGDRFRQVSDRLLTINPDDPGDMTRLREHLSTFLPCAGILHLWSLDHQLESQPAPAAERLTFGAVTLLQSMAVHGASKQTPVWFVTSGAQFVPGDAGPVALAAAPLWGFGRGAALEHPECWGGLIDLDPRAGALNAQLLFQHVSASDGEDEVAFRDGCRLVARMARSTAPPASEARLRSDGTYVLTGAFGGIGPQIAKWMVSRGATHLVLIGRSKLDDSTAAGKREVIRELEELGANVRAESCDVTDRPRLAELFASLEREWPALRGIVHAAADVHLKPLRELNRTDLESAFRAKVYGSWNLHELTRAADLDFFVCFSSAAGSTGARDRADYAAANQFMDALANERRCNRLPAVSIAWGAWEVLRMTTVAQRESILRSGYEAMPVKMALNAMSRLMQSGRANQTVARVDWSALKPAFEVRGRRQFVSEIETHAARPDTARNGDLHGRLQAAAPDRRREMLIEFISHEVQRILGLEPADSIDPGCGFFQLGMDSLMTVELKNRLATAVGCALPGTLTLNYPNLIAVAEYLERRLFALEEAPAQSAAPAAQPEAAVEATEVEDLTDAEAREALFSELRAIGARLDE